MEFCLRQCGQRRRFRNYRPGQLLTAGQYVALGQVMSVGSQSLILNNLGDAISGFVTLTPKDLSTLSGLSIPSSVTVDSWIHLRLSFCGDWSGYSKWLVDCRATSCWSNVSFNFGSLLVGIGEVFGNLSGHSNLFPGVQLSAGLTMNVPATLRILEQ